MPAEALSADELLAVLLGRPGRGARHRRRRPRRSCAALRPVGEPRRCGAVRCWWCTPAPAAGASAGAARRGRDWCVGPGGAPGAVRRVGAVLPVARRRRAWTAGSVPGRGGRLPGRRAALEHVVRRPRSGRRRPTGCRCGGCVDDADVARGRRRWSAALAPVGRRARRGPSSRGAAFAAFDGASSASGRVGFACHSVNRAAWLGPMAPTRAVDGQHGPGPAPRCWRGVPRPDGGRLPRRRDRVGRHRVASTPRPAAHRVAGCSVACSPEPPTADRRSSGPASDQLAGALEVAQLAEADERARRPRSSMVPAARCRGTSRWWSSTRLAQSGARARSSGVSAAGCR